MKRSLSPLATLCILTGLNLLNYLDRYVVSSVLPFIKSDLSLTDGQLGRISTAFMIGYFISSPVFGYLGDRGSRKWLIAAGIFVWSLGTVLTGFATGLGMLLLFRILVGLGEASYATISPGLISDTHTPEKRNNAFTIFYAAIPVGSALGFVLGANVAAAYGWKEAFVWAGAPGLLLALIMLPFREPKRGESEGKHNDECFQKKPSFRDVLGLFKIHDYNLILWGYTAYTFALGAYAFWGPTFLSRFHNISNEAANNFFGAALCITGLVGTLIGGFAATAFQKRHDAGYSLVLGISALLAAPVTLLSFYAQDLLYAQVLLILAMFLLFLSTGPINTLLIASVPVNLRSSAMAMSIFVIHFFGDMWSPEIVGHLSDEWQSLRHALLILPIALAIGAIFWMALAIKTVKQNGTPKN